MDSGYIQIFGLSIIFNYLCDLHNLLPQIIESSLQMLSKILYIFLVARRKLHVHPIITFVLQP